MGWADLHGDARVNASSPRAFGVCDRCGRWDNRHRLLDQVEYRGQELLKTGIVVCRDCYDDPQPQLRPVILPQDPKPVVNPRVEQYVFTNSADTALFDTWTFGITDTLGNQIFDTGNL
jgi:ribosomal protein L32